MSIFQEFLSLVRHPCKRSFALNELDLKLRTYLNWRKGFFIEAGANNGYNQSNTLYYEEYYRWNGILIEPIPELAEQCRRNRPGCIVENCALVPFDYKERTIGMYHCNLMSLVKGAMKSEEADSAHVKRATELQRVTPYELQVPARTLTSVLDQHHVRRIDFLSLDVEGYELNVLRGLDFERYRPTFMLIEARFRDEIEAFLKPHYKAIAEWPDYDVLYKCRHSKENKGLNEIARRQ